ncbi:MAG: polysaccharide deacetylase family protein [bacterium]|nr:MAG: polysaccharide deacetylase family protein [bacterium]
MKTETRSCINHSQTTARRKCFQCLCPICPACQKRALGHIFCSTRCQVLYWFSERITGLRQMGLRLSLRYRRLEKSVTSFTGGGVLRLATIALLMVILYQSTILVGAVRVLSTAQPPAPSLPPLPMVDLVQEGDWITVAGSAPGFGVAVLLADGVEWDVCTVREGTFSFTFQPEERIRSVQVQVYGDGMPTLHTRSLPLPAREETAAVGGKRGPASTGKKLRARPDPGPPADARAEAPVVKPGTVPMPEADLTRGRPDTGMVAITFDGGSYSNAAERILDVLAEKGLKATFFLTGEFMTRYPEVTARIAGEGHEVGNHTYSHLHLTTFEKNLRQDTHPGVDRDVLLQELRKNEELYFNLTGKRMVQLWRAPYGEQNETIRRWAGEAGYRHVSWTYDPKTRKSLDGLDWVSDRDSAFYLSSDQIVEKILSFDRETELGLAGGIVLLHLGSERKSDHFYPKLGQLIDRLQEKGYRIGSVSQILESGG